MTEEQEIKKPQLFNSHQSSLNTYTQTFYAFVRLVIHAVKHIHSSYTLILEFTVGNSILSNVFTVR